MIDTLNGQHYKNLINFGLMNLKLHCNEINELNVFPVPDGDTGTNMVNTLQNGYKSIADRNGDLSELAQTFAKAVTFGARGNSGVIVSQFFYGFSKSFFDKEKADCDDFVRAIEVGTEYAYKSVSNPVEGTVLTVLRETSEYISAKNKSGDYGIDEIIGLLLEKARISLENTPDLLPVLKSAGVVDSGGAGMVYFFEGVKKYIDGESVVSADGEKNETENDYVDYSCFDRESTFKDGYCTEFLLQLLDSAETLEKDVFLKEIESMGESVVTVFEEDKVKVHVHTEKPEQVMMYAHSFGEFLTLKIENMSVQNRMKKKADKGLAVEICVGERFASFSLITVTSDEHMRDIFIEMGSDIVVYSPGNIQPAVTEYLEAFKASGADSIFVFPNSKNSTLAANKAKDLFGGNVIIFDTKSDAECYAALSMIDFDEEDNRVIKETVDEVIENIYSVKVLQAVKDSKYDEITIHTGDFIGVFGDEVLSCDSDFVKCCTETVQKVSSEKECNAVTFFTGDCDGEALECVKKYIADTYPWVETDTVETESNNFATLISFE